MTNFLVAVFQQGETSVLQAMARSIHPSTPGKCEETGFKTSLLTLAVEQLLSKPVAQLLMVVVC